MRKTNATSLSLGVLSIIILSSSCSLSYATHELGTMFGDPKPKINDANLRVQEVTKGLHLPAHMAFVNNNEILVLEKNNGTVRRVVNGTISDQPLLDVNVASEIERGMLGIALSKRAGNTYVFVYFTESDSKDGGKPLGNILYRYELLNDKLINPKLLLDLPFAPGPYHNGGALSIGPDDNLYLSVGDINGACQELAHLNGSCQTTKTKAQNYINGSDPDGRSGILRLTQDGDIVGDGVLADSGRLGLYYAYGIRNSFGFDFDPVTGHLWDTENGPDYGDEINLVELGFNSGWTKVQGIWKANGTHKGNVDLDPGNLYEFGGKGKYSKPEFTWLNTIGVSAIAFIDSDKYGDRYRNDLLIGDVNNGNLYHFNLNEKRTGLILKEELADKVADVTKEYKDVILGHNFGEITDIKVGPDGYLYILIYSQQYGKILKVLPQDTINN